MAAKLTKTKTPGVYKRGSRYLVAYRDADGTQRRESTVSYNAACELKHEREAEAKLRASGSGPTRLGDYALEWVERYNGRGRRGFREITRKEYRRDLKHYVLPYFGGRTLSQITPRDVANFVGWLCDGHAQGRVLADATVRRILAPLRSCLATAMHEGLIRTNPTAGASLPSRDAVRAAEAGEEDEPDRRALSRDELAALLTVAPERYRPLFRLLASTGLRISEALALRWRDLRLDGSRPVVKVRRAYVKGRFVPPKSKHGRRDVPLANTLVLELRRLRAQTDWPGDDDFVFCAHDGRPLHDRNLSARVLKPAVEEAGAPWAGWHTLRHTCASLLFAEGRNAVQVQRWLGHHSPAFTLSTYVHLLDEDLGEPLDVGGGNRVITRGPLTAANSGEPVSAEATDLRGNPKGAQLADNPSR
jgi:integrase